ncbi:MAG: amidase family protein [Candidatus Nanohaloarchaea archaeon]|nr:amidase family protein [Candidatus Nanohaloarchaea archaeon]
MSRSKIDQLFDSDGEVDTAELRERVERIDSEIRAVRSTNWEESEVSGELNGLPVSVKDNICVEGMQATAGSRILEDYRPPFTATAVERLQEEGAQVFAKTNMDEFGFGTFSTNSAYEVPKNPHDTDRVTGGSSGGAAALTAALDLPHAALGQSTGGSISCPAAFCGVVGLTPTYGRVSRYGLIDYSNSMDRLGPITCSVHDAAQVLDIISGQDKQDPTTSSRDMEDLSGIEGGVEGMKIGVPKQYIGYKGVDPEVRDEVWRAIKRLEDMGAEYEKIDMPMISGDYTIPAYYITSMSEASTNLARYCGMRYGLEGSPEGEGFEEYFSKIRSRGFGEEAVRRILLGHFSRQAGYRNDYYLKALKIRQLVIDEFKDAFQSFDLLAAPTMPVVAPTFEDAEEMDPVEVYAMDTLTVGPNFAGLPQLSLPTGKVKDMPVGLHLIADHFNESKLVKAGTAYEDRKGFVELPEV